MQIVYNGLKGKTSNNYTCRKCNSIINVSKGEMFIGYLGDSYFRCPVCGKYIIAESFDGYQKAEDIVYPFSFYNYTSDYTSSVCTDSDINEMIKDVFKDGLEEMKMNIVEYGDTMVLAIEDGVDEDGKPIYQLYVCKNSDTTTCTKD